ncbi:hypothetical protein PRIC2_001942 [Phytophthora ramorum]
MVASESRGERQIHVLLTLLDGERSFGMSLAQKSPALGPKYTVVSSVFANSPAARAGVRQGYVVRYINDKPMGGLTVAQVANNFRNVAQASITLEIVDTVSPRTSAFTAAVTFGGVSTNQAGGGQRSVAPVTGFSVVSSGRAIAAPGTALAGPKIAAPKQSVVRFGAKLAAKTTTGMAGSSNVSGKGGVMSDADAKLPNSARHTSLKSKAVAPVLRLGPTPKSVRSDIAAQKVAGSSAKQDAPKPAAKTVPGSSVAEKGDTSSRIPRSPIQAMETPKRSPGAQAEKAEQLKRVAAPAKAFVPVPTLAKFLATKSATSPTTSNKPASAPATLPVKAAPADVVTPTEVNHGFSCKYTVINRSSKCCEGLSSDEKHKFSTSSTRSTARDGSIEKHPSTDDKCTSAYSNTK